MSRGFSVSATVTTADELTVESFSEQLKAGLWLTGNEQTVFLNAAVAGAQVLVRALPGGPFRVTLSGADRSLEVNETSVISTTVMSDFTISTTAPVAAAPDPVVTPEPVAAPEPEPVATPEPVAEVDVMAEAPVAPEPTPDAEAANG